MRDGFDNIPKEFLPLLLDSYFSGSVIVCDFSFPLHVRERMRRNTDEAAELLASCLSRIARRYRVEFNCLTTGNLTRTDQQIHFHLWILVKGVSNASLDAISEALQGRWEFLANDRRRPESKRLSEGYSIVSTMESYMESFRRNGEEVNDLDTMNFKLAYNLNLDEHDWLWTENHKIYPPDRVISYHQRHHIT